MTNPSGLEPVEFNVILKPDEVEERTKGGLILPEETASREKWVVTRGTIVASSLLAFNDDIWPSDHPIPEPGQRVVFGKHAGTTITGEDGQEYRIVKDRDIVALIG